MLILNNVIIITFIQKLIGWSFDGQHKLTVFILHTYTF